MFCPLLVASADVYYTLVTSSRVLQLTRSVHKHLWLLIKPCKTLPNHNKNSGSPREVSFPANGCLNSSRYFKCHFCGTFTTFSAYVLCNVGRPLHAAEKARMVLSSTATGCPSRGSVLPCLFPAVLWALPPAMSVPWMKKSLCWREMLLPPKQGECKSPCLHQPNNHQNRTHKRHLQSDYCSLCQAVKKYFLLAKSNH